MFLYSSSRNGWVVSVMLACPGQFYCTALSMFPVTMVLKSSWLKSRHRASAERPPFLSGLEPQVLFSEAQALSKQPLMREGVGAECW